MNRILDKLLLYAKTDVLINDELKSTDYKTVDYNDVIRCLKNMQKDNKEKILKAQLENKMPTKSEIEEALVADFTYCIYENSCHSCILLKECVDTYLKENNNKTFDIDKFLNTFPIYQDDADLYCEKYRFDEKIFFDDFALHVKLINWFEKNYLIDGQKVIDTIQNLYNKQKELRQC